MPVGAILGGVSAVAGISSGRKAAKAADRQAAAAEAAAAEQAEISREQLALSKEQQDWAREDRARYKRDFEPLETQLIDESRGLGSQANQNQVAQQAAADVASSFAGVRERLSRTPGLRTNSQAYLQEANRINLAEAAASAASQTGARQTARDRGVTALTNAANIGRNLPGSATSGLSGAASTMGSAASGMRSAADFAGRMAGQYGQQSADAWGAAGRVVGGLSQNKGFMDFINGPEDTGFGSVPGGYVAPDTGTVYNNPSAFVAG